MIRMGAPVGTWIAIGKVAKEIGKNKIYNALPVGNVDSTYGYDEKIRIQTHTNMMWIKTPIIHVIQITAILAKYFGEEAQSSVSYDGFDFTEVLGIVNEIVDIDDDLNINDEDITVFSFGARLKDEGMMVL